jgi:hypothetical protein
MHEAAKQHKKMLQKYLLSSLICAEITAVGLTIQYRALKK